MRANLAHKTQPKNNGSHGSPEVTHSPTSTVLRRIDAFKKSTKLPSTHNTNVTTMPARQSSVSRFAMQLTKTCHQSHVQHWYKWHLQTSVLLSWVHVSSRPRSHFLRFWMHLICLKFAVSSLFNFVLICATYFISRLSIWWWLFSC